MYPVKTTRRQDFVKQITPNFQKIDVESLAKDGGWPKYLIYCYFYYTVMSRGICVERSNFLEIVISLKCLLDLVNFGRFGH